MAKEYQWRTAAVIRETKDAVTIVFDTGGAAFQYRPGQFVNVGLRINGQYISRSYSLSSSPDADERPAITVKKVAGGVMSSYIVDHAETIKVWTIDGPHGLFHLPVDTKALSHVVLIAGGSGVTPIYSMLKYMLKYTAATITVVYSSKIWEDKIFGAALINLAQLYPDRLNLHLVLSQSSTAEHETGARCLNGRLSRLVLKKLLKSTAADSSATFFVCGPTGLIALAEETLATLQVDSARINKEYFFPEDLKKEQVVLPGTVQEVLLHFYEQSNLLEVAPGKTILEAALTDRIELPYSCKNGTCGKCTGKLLAGQVHMAQNFVLNESQLQEGYILLCQSHPMTNDVTVEAL